MKLKNPRLWITAFGVMVVFAVLSLFFWSFLRDTVVLPLYRFLIVLRYGINAVPQGLYLFVLFLVLVVLAIRAVYHTFDGQVSWLNFEDDNVPPYPADSASRYRFWRMETGTLTRSNFARNDFARNTRRLILEIIAHQEHRPWEEIERRVMRGEAVLPPLVDALIRDRELRSSRPVKTGLDAMMTRIARQLGLPLPETPDPAMEEQVNAIIHFIEERLEIVRDESTQP